MVRGMLSRCDCAVRKDGTKYQHPELEQVRRVLNDTNSNYNPEQGLNGTFYGTVTKQ